MVDWVWFGVSSMGVLSKKLLLWNTKGAVKVAFVSFKPRHV